MSVPKISDDSGNRWRRSHHRPQWSDPEWPPRANDNWLEVLVVADGPMLKYHGQKLEQYILTLMQIVRNSKYLLASHRALMITRTSGQGQ